MLHERQAELLELQRKAGNGNVESGRLPTHTQPQLNNQLLDDEDKDVNERESQNGDTTQVSAGILTATIKHHLRSSLTRCDNLLHRTTMIARETTIMMMNKRKEK